MYGDNPNDKALKASWDNFCDELKSAGDLIFRDTTPVQDIDRAKGLRLLARNVSLALQFHLDDPREVVVAGEPDDPTTRAFLDNLRSGFSPHRVVTLLHEGNRDRLAGLSEIFAGKDPVGDRPAAYVCRRGVCEAPVLDPAKLELR